MKRQMYNNHLLMSSNISLIFLDVENLSMHVLIFFLLGVNQMKKSKKFSLICYNSISK